MKKSIFAAGIALATLTGANAYAASIPTLLMSTFDIDSFNTAAAGGTIEDFKDYTEDGPFTTSVGTFSSLGGSGSGSVCKAQSDGNCTNLWINDTTLSGQGNLVGDNNVLSSNDTLGIKWEAYSGGQAFDQIIFGVRDAADQGGNTFEILVNGTKLGAWSGLGNNNQKLVVIDLGEMVTKATVELRNSQLNDGLTLDGATTRVSNVPLPAAAWLFLSGLGVLGAIRKRKQNVA